MSVTYNKQATIQGRGVKGFSENRILQGFSVVWFIEISVITVFGYSAVLLKWTRLIWTIGLLGISCCEMLILCLNHTGELKLFYSLLSFSTFSFYVFVTLTVLFLGASLVCVNNLKRTADLVLWFPNRTAVCTHPWRLI